MKKLISKRAESQSLEFSSILRDKYKENLTGGVIIKKVNEINNTTKIMFDIKKDGILFIKDNMIILD